jgi:DNA processing protein
MKTNTELANELEKLVINPDSFASTLKVMSWHIDRDTSERTPEQKVWAAFHFLVQPEFDRLPEFGLSTETKDIITKMVYERSKDLFKYFLIEKKVQPEDKKTDSLKELFEESGWYSLDETYDYILEDDNWDILDDEDEEDFDDEDFEDEDEEDFGEPLEMFTDFDEHDKEYLTLLAIQYKGDWKQMNLAIRNMAVININRDKVLMDLYKSDIKVVTIFEDEYPELLKKSFQPPFVLFYVGDLSLVNQAHRSIGLLGKELITNRLLREGNLVTLIGEEQIEIQSKDSHLFVSTTFGGPMNDYETSKLFDSLSNELYLDNAQEKTVTRNALMLAIAFDMKITSTPNRWVKLIAGEDAKYVSSFVDLL